jgi:hypothetical protein
MKKIYFTLWCAFCAWLLNGCDSNVSSGGSGDLSSETGSAALSLQLEELSAGENYISGDGVLLNFSTFAMAFSKITLGSEELSADFTADFFDEEVIDVIELEEVPTGEYDAVTLTLGTASGLSGAAVLTVKNAAVGSDVTSSLNGNSILVVGEGINGGATCNLRVELVSDGMIPAANDAGNQVEVKSGEEAEVVVVVDPDRLFEDVALAPLCADGADVTISSDSNPSHAAAILDNLLSNEVVELGSAEGHAHSH